MGAGRLQPGDVGGLVARIAGKVLGGRELARVDEDGDDHPVGAPDGLFDQPDMALMQRPHGGHQSRVQALRPPRTDTLAQLLDGTDGGEADGRHG